MKLQFKVALAAAAVLISGIATTRISFSSQSDKLEKIQIQDGFKIEHLHAITDSKQGSWVAMAFDSKGRLITSDQFGGLYRLTIPEIGSKNLSPKIEKLTLEGEQFKLGTAQGLLYAHNALYVMVNNHPNKENPQKSGLYKVEDTDNNDQFDKVTLMKELAGDGEHGPHSVILSPDGKSLYVIAGNHTDAPKMDSYRLPNTWKHDNLYPFIKDPRGHATDRTEPGGWIAKVNPENNHWEFVSGGYRNAFDIAFNENDDLFVYDSDMEWEFGLPWYRPTRICHVTSGSEYGWRTASGKWPVYFADNLPPVINIGQGSPTNLVSLKNAKFPESFQNSLLAFDWSFGIVHKITLKSKGSSYSAEREEFLSGVPLPLTDGVIGPDGALYFLTGGRRLESDLYRVHYTGKDPIKTAVSKNINSDNELRRNLEKFHEGTNAQAIDAAWPHLDHKDIFIQHAARIAVEHQPLASWNKKALSETSNTKAIYALMALIRADEKVDKIAFYSALQKIDFKSLSSKHQLDLLRVYELFFARTSTVLAAHKQHFEKTFFASFPTQNEEIDKQFAKIFVHLGTSGVIPKILKFMQEKEDTSVPVGGETATSSEDLILRNPAYGLDIAKMLEKLPPARQTYYAILLSPLKTGWTPEYYNTYFSWFKNALKYQGGLSYIGFLDRARKTAIANAPKAQQAAYDKLSGGDLLSENGNDVVDITYPKGPGKNWKTEEAAALFSTELKGRNYEQGRNMYIATLCNRCHSMQGEGANIGPDLTQLATRFSTKDILEAIIEPNKAISDQYASTQFKLKNGETVVGKIISEDIEFYHTSQNPFTPEITTKILKRNVISKQPAAVSMMLPGLINSLNEEELKDLMAYLIAAGKPDHKVFK